MLPLFAIVTNEGVLKITPKDMRASAASWTKTGWPANLEAWLLMDVVSLYCRELHMRIPARRPVNKAINTPIQSRDVNAD